MSTKRRAPSAGKTSARKKAPKKRKAARRREARVPVAEMHPDEASFNRVYDMLTTVAKERAQSPNYSAEDCADVALRLSERAARHEHRLGHLDRAIPGIAEDFENLPRLARALRFIQGRLLRAQASEGGGRIPEEIIVEGDQLRTRMGRVMTYHFGDNPKIAATLDYLRGGVGHRDRASDLEELASLYEDHAAVLEHDRTHYRPEDAARARELAVEILDLLGRPRGGTVVEWTELRAAAHALVAETYERVRRVVLAIESSASLDDHPPLASAIRALRPR
ncbi:hypothetical protein L6R52_22500, partial [Myxococcota bacterium]|nr:hypothetical protein [Myxococcota bacterium]